jgi:hypothetical protein
VMSLFPLQRKTFKTNYGNGGQGDEAKGESFSESSMEPASSDNYTAPTNCIPYHGLSRDTLGQCDVIISTCYQDGTDDEAII